MRQWLKSRTAKSVLLVALAVGAYALAGFVIAPRVVRSQLIARIHDALGLTPSVGDIRINPFLFQVEVRDFALPGADGEKLLGFERLFVDFELSSIVHRAYTFRAIELDAPVVYAKIAKDGALNLMQLKPKPPSPPSPPRESGSLPALRVASLTGSRGSAGYQDRSRPTEFSLRLEPIDFELRDFSTGASGGLFSFSGDSLLGERIEWQGHLSVQPIESDGLLRIEGLHARTVWSYLEDQLNFVISSGTLDGQAHYRFALSDSVDLKIEVPKITLTDLKVRPRDAATDWLTLPALEVSGTTFDLRARQARVDRVMLDHLTALAWLEPGGALNLMQLAEPRAAATQPTAAPAPVVVPVAAASGPGVPAGPPLRFELSTVELREADVHAEDRGVRPSASVELAPLNVTVQGASLDLTKPIEVALDAKVAGGGDIGLQGTVTPQPLLADVGLKLANLDLTALEPYVAKFTGMTLKRGSLGANATLHFGRAPGKPDLQISGLVSVDHLHTVDDVLHDDFIDWQRLEIRGLNYHRAPDGLAVAEVVVRKPYARVIIESDASMNVKRVLTAPGTAGPTAPPPASPPASPPSAPPPRSAGPARTAGAVTPAAAPAAGLPMSIKKIAVLDGRVNFSDRTVQPNFSAGIQALAGGIVGLSSDPKSRA